MTAISMAAPKRSKIGHRRRAGCGTASRLMSNHQRYHESLDNVTPADADGGRASAIIKQRERIKRQTIEQRLLHHRKLAA